MELWIAILSTVTLLLGYFLRKKTKNQEFLDALHKAQEERDRAAQDSLDALSKHDYDLGRDLDSLLKKNRHNPK